MADWRAIPRMTQAMQEQRDEDPRGDLYRSLTMDDLINRAEQNWKELKYRASDGKQWH